MNRITTNIEEVWKSISEYEGNYSVSNLGHVKSNDHITIGKNGYIYHKKGKCLKLHLDKNTGYYYAGLYFKGKHILCTVHRLVAQAFIPNPDNLPCVNHKDENKLNNRVNNLEWITNYDNLLYSDAWNKIAHNRRDYTGDNNPFYGKTHSDSVKKKLSEWRKGRIRITDGVISKVVTIQEFEKTYQKLGWKRGMIKHYDEK